MNTLTGNLEKMHVVPGKPIDYFLPLGEERLHLNPLIGQQLSLMFEGAINCIACGRSTRKSFSQGYCFPCVQRLAECDSCIVSPERCHFDAGTCRDPAWAEGHCMQDHYVYLANTSGLKVGITRGTQLPTRWIDQGATQGLPIFRVRNRFQSGLIEATLKARVADRTDWRKMLRGDAEPLDLQAERDRLLEECAKELGRLREEHGDALELLPDAELMGLEFPVEQHPTKITSLNFDKQPCIEGVLLGIKGQYLILDAGVLNIRKFGGYRITVHW